MNFWVNVGSRFHDFIPLGFRQMSGHQKDRGETSAFFSSGLYIFEETEAPASTGLLLSHVHSQRRAEESAFEQVGYTHR